MESLRARRWWARASLGLAVLSAVTLLVLADNRGLWLVLVTAVAVAVVLAAAFWFLQQRGVLRWVALAVAVARAARTVPAWLLAVVGVAGGLVFGAAAPLVAITQNPAFTALFSADALVSVWLVGTALRLLLAHRTAVPA